MDITAYVKNVATAKTRKECRNNGGNDWTSKR